MNNSSKKTEKKAINYIEEMINDIDFLDCKFNSEDTGQSWDGYIDIFNSSNIDKKGNFTDRLLVQIKGRTAYTKTFSRKIKFDMDVEDLENYKKVDGTIFFLVKINQKGEHKIYYSSLLPNKIINILEENENNSKSVKVTLFEVKDIHHLERICIDFYNDKQIQKKLDLKVFNNKCLSADGKAIGKFNYYTKSNISMFELLGEERNIYIEENNEIVGIECLEIDKIAKRIELSIGIEEDIEYYSNYNYEKDISGNEEIKFGKSFTMNIIKRNFNIIIKGSLDERIKDLKFICLLNEKNGFYINNIKFDVVMEKNKIDKYKKILKSLEKIKEFCNYLKIDKDIELDNWKDEDYRKIFVWINAIMQEQTVNVPNWELDSIGSIEIKDLRFSVMTSRKEDTEFYINSIWDRSLIGKHSFKYENGNIEIYTNNLFSVLNKDVYISDDVDIEQMIEYYDNYKLNDDEEILVNLQVLEVINAYDITKNEKLLEYAEYLLNKILKFSSMSDVAKINLMQINKRRKIQITEEDTKALLDIRNRNSNDNMFLLAIAIIMENKSEINYIFNNMPLDEKEEFKKFPLYNLMIEILQQK